MRLRRVAADIGIAKPVACALRLPFSIASWEAILACINRNRRSNCEFGSHPLEIGWHTFKDGLNGATFISADGAHTAPVMYLRPRLTKRGSDDSVGKARFQKCKGGLVGQTVFYLTLKQRQCLLQRRIFRFGKVGKRSNDHCNIIAKSILAERDGILDGCTITANPHPSSDKKVVDRGIGSTRNPFRQGERHDIRVGQAPDRPCADVGKDRVRYGVAADPPRWLRPVPQHFPPTNPAAQPQLQAAAAIGG